MSIILPVAGFKTTLTSRVTATGTTIYIDSVVDDAGNNLSGTFGFIIDEGDPTEETIIGTIDAASSRLISCVRGVSPTDGTTEVAALQSPHRKKATIKISDHPYLLLAIRALNGTDATGGVMKNPSSRTISHARHLVDKEYADALAAAAGGITAFYVTDNGGLTINVGAGKLVTSEGVVEYAGAAAQACTDAATNYVELDHNGVLRLNTTGWTRGYVPLATVVCAGGDITSISDARGWLTAPESDRVITDDATFGATIAVNDIVYLDTATGKWKLATASAEATADGVIGVAMDAGADGDTGKRVQVGGVVTGMTGLTAGWVFLSDTAGDVAATAGTYRRVIGYAPNTTSMALVTSVSADEITGGNSSLTTAIINEMATFFANTDATGLELETLTAGSSQADTLHEHSLLRTYRSLFQRESYNLIHHYNFAATSGVTTTTTGAGSAVTVRAGSVTIAAVAAVGDKCTTTAGLDTPSSVNLWDRDFWFAESLMLETTPNTFEAFWGFGSATCGAGGVDANATSVDPHIGFFWDNGTLYASCGDGAAQTRTNITSGVTIGAPNWYEIVFDAGVSASFYVNGTLKATISTNLPTGSSTNMAYAHGVQCVTNDGTTKTMRIFECLTAWKYAA